jgi:hypothetical protein
MFNPSAGLLLRDEIHHAFDRLELSFYFKVCRSSSSVAERGQFAELMTTVSQDGTYYIHFFLLQVPLAREFHGKSLPSNRFRGLDRDKPDPRFIRWHYNQCIKARIRGFAARMDIPSTSDEVVALSVS